MLLRKSIFVTEGHWRLLLGYAAAKGFDSPSLAIESLIRQLVQSKEPVNGRRETQAH